MISIIIMILLIVTNLSGLVKISMTVLVISGIINTLYHAPNYLVFSLQGNFKNIEIGSAEHSWGDVKKIKSGKRSALGSDISEKQSFMYTSDCIEEERIVKTMSKSNSNESSHNQYWNDEDHDFDYYL